MNSIGFSDRLKLTPDDMKTVNKLFQMGYIIIKKPSQHIFTAERALHVPASSNALLEPELRWAKPNCNKCEKPINERGLCQECLYEKIHFSLIIDQK
jgi:hypothetical protein